MKTAQTLILGFVLGCSAACGRIAFDSRASLVESSDAGVDASRMVASDAVDSREVDDAGEIVSVTDSGVVDPGENDAGVVDDAGELDAGEIDAGAAACSPPAGCVAVPCSRTGPPLWYCPDIVTAAEAQARCATIGASLACPRTAEDQACLSAAPTVRTIAWMGGVQSSTATSVDADWTCGQAPLAPVWRAGDPNDNGFTGGVEDHEQDCAWFSLTLNEWVDATCTEAWPFFCEGGCGGM